MNGDTFRALGHRVIDQLADHLTRAQAGELPVLPWRAPDAMLAEWPPTFPASADGDLPELLARVLQQSIHLHHPRYIGHQVSAPDPEAALCDLVASLLNNGMAVYEMGAVATVMERSVLRWMATQLGYGDGADGVLTNGGSAGNLTALLAARQAQAGFDAWGEGLHGGPPLAVLVGESAHYSVARSLQIMGCGAGAAIKVPVDARFRIRPDALPGAYDAAIRAGRRVIAVVASAASTATGAFDPISPIADFCDEKQLWLHVDGAHGASAALSPRYRALVHGIERADSVIWDAHKMMLMPALITAVIFKEGRRSREAFAQEASYLFVEDPRWWDVGTRTLECTKKMLALKLYAALALRGTDRIAAHVTDMFDRAQRFAARLAAAGDFEVIEPDCNIVCFRLAARDDAFQERARAELCESGAFYLVKTRLPGGIYLRVTVINPLTTDADLDALADAVRAISRRDA